MTTDPQQPLGSSPGPEPTPSIRDLDRVHLLADGPEKEIGAPPGALVIPPDTPPPVIDVAVYDDRDYARNRLAPGEDLGPYLAKAGTLWIDVNGLGDAATLIATGNALQLHKLTLEDIVHLEQRPKVEDYGDQLYAVVRYPVFEPDLDFEQISIVLKERCVLSVQATAVNRFDAIVRRLAGRKGHIRSSGADFLFYALIDLTVDAYLPLLEQVEEWLEAKEDAIAIEQADVDVRDVYRTRHNLTAMRRSLWGVRAALTTLLRDGHPLILPSTLVYLRDTHDHVERALAVTETLRETCTSLLDQHRTMLGQRMNDIIKVLTIMATLFIPLTFIAGIYGMNFDPDVSPWNMPELRWRFGYPAVWGLLIGVGSIMLYFFRRLGWLGRRPAGRLASLSDSDLAPWKNKD